MNKKYALLLPLCLLVLICCACAGGEAKPQNYIAAKQLTPEQQDLILLLGHDQAQYLLFEYQTTEPYRYVDFWVEIYKDGELIEERANGTTFLNDEATAQAGEMAVIIEDNDGYQWAFRTPWARTFFNEPNQNYIPYRGAGGGPGGPLVIEEDKELVLYARLFSESNSSFRADTQIYVEQPELLKEYTYAHLVKCKFSNTANTQ